MLLYSVRNIIIIDSHVEVQAIFLIPTVTCPLVIGNNGHVIKAMQNDTGANVKYRYDWF